MRGDDDLVFYNHPSQEGVALKGQTVVTDLAAVPGAIDRIAVVASIDPELRATHFDASNTPHAVIECGDARITFEPPPLTDRETVAILIELYRRAGGWKTRAVGQGWDTGLAGLASDFGIVVDDPEPATVQMTPAQARDTHPAYAQHTRQVAEPRHRVTPPRALVPLGKVALTKAGQATIDMRKEDPSLVVTATLEWNGGSEARRRAGADLDLSDGPVETRRSRDLPRRGAELGRWPFGCFTITPVDAAGSTRKVPEDFHLRSPLLRLYNRAGGGVGWGPSIGGLL